MQRPLFSLHEGDAVSFLGGLPGESVDLLVTDPPYESLEKHRSVGTTTRLSHSKSSSNDWFRVFPNARFEELFSEMYRVLRRDSHLYLFCDQETMFVCKPIAERVGFRFWKPLVWDKCIAPDTPIWTTEGVRRAAELTVGDRVATPDGRDVAILATRVTRSPSLRLALSDGTYLVCAVDHRFVRSDGVEVEAHLLVPGTALAEADLKLKPSQDELSPEALSLDYGLGKLMGIYAAEGGRSDHSVVFALHKNETHLQNHIARTARSLGVRATITSSGERGTNVTVSSEMFSQLIGAFVGGSDAASKVFKPLTLQAPSEFLRGVFDGLIESHGHWSHEEQRETYTSASLDLACFVLRHARKLGYQANIHRVENGKGGAWSVRFDPHAQAKPLVVVSVEEAGELELIDVAIDDPGQLYVLGNGVISHNCKIGMGYHYRARYEFILFFEKGKRRLKDLGVADVLSVPRVHGGYPTEKPVELAEVLVEQSSEPGALVVDPFCGSGAFGLAACRRGRNFAGNDVKTEAIQWSRRRIAEVGLEMAAELPLSHGTPRQLAFLG